MAKRIRFAEKTIAGATAAGTPIGVKFVASRARGNFVAVAIRWNVGKLANETERIFGPLETQNAFGQVNEWVEKICKQVGVENTSSWRKAGEV